MANAMIHNGRSLIEASKAVFIIGDPAILAAEKLAK